MMVCSCCLSHPSMVSMGLAQPAAVKICFEKQHFPVAQGNECLEEHPPIHRSAKHLHTV